MASLVCSFQSSCRESADESQRVFSHHPGFHWVSPICCHATPWWPGCVRWHQSLSTAGSGKRWVRVEWELSASWVRVEWELSESWGILELGSPEQCLVKPFLFQSSTCLLNDLNILKIVIHRCIILWWLPFCFGGSHHCVNLRWLPWFYYHVAAIDVLPC